MKKKFGAAFRGLLEAFHHPSVLIQGILGCGAVGVSFLLHFSQVEWIAVLLCIGLVIVTEIVNTCIEKVCDEMTQETKESIRSIKDISAGAVLMASLVALVVGLICIGNHLG